MNNTAKQKLCSIRRTELLKSKTKSEKQFGNILSSFGIKFSEQKGFIRGNGFYIVDFYLPKPFKICIEIDGKIHDLPHVKKRDILKDNYLRKERGFRVIRIKNEFIQSLPKDKNLFLMYLIKNSN